MSRHRKRLASVGVAALFCLLCLGTSRPKRTSSSKPAPAAVTPKSKSSAAARIAPGIEIEGRLDPLDPKLPNDGGHHDAFVLSLKRGQSYRVTIRPGAGAPSDAGVVDAGIGPLWFSVRVMRGSKVQPSKALSVQERVRDGGATDATFTAETDGDHTVAVTAYFGHDEAATPGFSTYVLQVAPLSGP